MVNDWMNYGGMRKRLNQGGAGSSEKLPMWVSLRVLDMYFGTSLAEPQRTDQ
jgi:hypothetical protein